MRQLHKIKVFTDRYPLLGPLIWISSIEYFVIQLIVASAWSLPYSWRFNTISDLGNNACGIFNGRAVCSPWHSLMNASFITLGIIMASGSLLIYQEFRKKVGTLIGFTLMAIAGLGTVLVGIFPENTVATLHTIGAFSPFLIGNISLVVLSFALFRIPRLLRLITFIAGAVPLVALTFFVSRHYGNLGEGGVERIVAFPQTIWLVIFGLYMSRKHISYSKSN